MIHLIINKNTKLIKYFLFFFIFVIFVSLNLLIQKPHFLLFIKSFLLIRFPLFILFPFIFDFDNKILDKKFKIIFIIPILIFLINLYSQAFIGYDIFGNILLNDYQRITSFFGDEYIAGSYLFFIFAILILTTKKFKTLIILLLIIIYFGIFLSGDRTPFLMVNFFLILIFSMNIKKLISIKFISILIIVPAIILSLVLLESNKTIKLTAIDKYKGTYKNLMDDLKNKENNQKNDLGLKRWPYYGMYSKSLVIFKNNIFFGTAYKSFRNECGNERYNEDYSKLTDGLEYIGCSTHPHNIYLEILSEQGLFGFIFFILLIYNFVKISSKHINLNNINYKIFLIVYFFPIKPFGSFYTNFGLIMLSSSIALFIIFNKKNS